MRRTGGEVPLSVGRWSTDSLNLGRNLLTGIFTFPVFVFVLLEADAPQARKIFRRKRFIRFRLVWPSALSRSDVLVFIFLLEAGQRDELGPF